MIYPRYSQRDPQWAGDLLGNSHGSTLSQYGCLLTSFAMLAYRTPHDMNICMRDTGGFQPEPKGSYAATFNISACAPNVRMVWTSGKYAKVAFPKPQLTRTLDHLRGGQPAIIEVDFSPSVGQQQHFVMAEHAIGDDIHINDPWPRPGEEQALVLTSRYGRTNAIAIIRVILYEVSG